MQEDFENCINIDVVEKPNEWATNFIMKNDVFLIWDQNSKLKAAAEAGQAVTSACPNFTDCKSTGNCSSCQGCATVMAFIYKEFEKYINQRFAEEFKTYSEEMFKQLSAANSATTTSWWKITI